MRKFWMIEILLVITAAMMVIAAVVIIHRNSGGRQDTQTISEPKVQTSQDYVSGARTAGNHSYVELNLGGRPNINVQIILGVLYTFEKSHMELEVTSWSLDNRMSEFGNTDFIYGMWINHKPRAKQIRK